MLHAFSYFDETTSKSDTLLFRPKALIQVNYSLNNTLLQLLLEFATAFFWQKESMTFFEWKLQFAPAKENSTALSAIVIKPFFFFVPPPSPPPHPPFFSLSLSRTEHRPFSSRVELTAEFCVNMIFFPHQKHFGQFSAGLLARSALNWSYPVRHSWLSSRLFAACGMSRRPPFNE